MDWYGTWFYTDVLNAVWFLRTVVAAVLIFNVIVPVVIWYLTSGRPIFKRRRSKPHDGR